MEDDTIIVQSNGTGTSTNQGLPENPFSCNVCKRSYTRVDHLTRHYRSHTRERPFVCQTCGKSFARIDLLKRHATNHNDDDGPNKRRKTLQSSTTPRVSKACGACAEAKLKCEGTQPCPRCQQKSLTCEYPSSRSSRSFDASRPSDASRNESGLSTDEPDILERRHTISSSSHAEQTGSLLPTIQFLLPTETELAIPNNNPIDVMNHGMHVPELNVQLPTPSTYGQDPPPLPPAPGYDHDLMMSFDDLPLIDFLKETRTHTPADRTSGLHDDMNIEPFPKDVLDFGIDLVFDTPDLFNTDMMFSADQFAPRPPALLEDEENYGGRSGLTTPGGRRTAMIGSSTQAFKESIWLWTPEKEDHGQLEQLNLSLPFEGVTPERQQRINYPPFHEQVNKSTRGKILAMVLSTCEPVIYSHVVSNFPSVELLTNLIHNFISFHLQQDLMWVHPATIQPNKESPEFLASMIAYGAAISSVPEIRKLGFAIQEAVRVGTPMKFERDNRSTRELRPLQGYALYLDVGLWSGNRRKMEIAESFAMPLLTMVRRAGHYRRSRVAELPPQQEDTGDALEWKWRQWIERESYKRLALYLFYRDARSSMSLLSQPLLSYAEISVDLPCSKELWLAKTATDWKMIYLSRHLGEDGQPPSLRSCMDDSTPIFKNQRVLDVEMALLLVIAAVWPLIWQYREMKSAAKHRSSAESRTSTLTMNSRHQEISQVMQHISLNTTEWLGTMKPAARLLHEQCLMHLYVSLEDVQLLAGKEGEEEARRAFPALTAWVESSEARQALCHAGQVIRAAKEYKDSMLRDASAVAVYHASLVFWAYAVLSRGEQSHQSTIFNGGSTSSDKLTSSVRLDAEDSPEVRRFLVLGKGIPCIQRWSDNTLATTAGPGDSIQEVPISEPAEVMNAIISFLHKQHSTGDKSWPPLLENLSSLMLSLGKAATGRRRR